MKLYCVSTGLHWIVKVVLIPKMWRIDLSQNYVNPLCCVATVCHQVRCMYWGHLGHFHRAISHLKWYKIVCMGYLACTFSQMKSINMFSMFLQSGVPRHFLWRFIAVWTYNLTVFMFMNVNVDPKLSRQYAETWVLGMFSCFVRQGKYIWGLGNWFRCLMAPSCYLNQCWLIVIPPEQRSCWGVYWFHSVRPSVPPAVSAL